MRLLSRSKAKLPLLLFFGTISLYVTLMRLVHIQHVISSPPPPQQQQQQQQRRHRPSPRVSSETDRFDIPYNFISRIWQLEYNDKRLTPDNINDINSDNNSTIESSKVLVVVRSDSNYGNTEEKEEKKKSLSKNITTLTASKNSASFSSRSSASFGQRTNNSRGSTHATSRDTANTPNGTMDMTLLLSNGVGSRYKNSHTLKTNNVNRRDSDNVSLEWRRDIKSSDGNNQRRKTTLPTTRTVTMTSTSTSATTTVTFTSTTANTKSPDMKNHNSFKSENANIQIFQNLTTSPAPKIHNPHPYHFIFDANDLCSRRDPPFLLVLVPSIHDHMDIRNAIRQTWGSVAKGRTWPGRTVGEVVKLAFLLGLHQLPERESLLTNENGKHGDIIQENFVDSYYNLSIKMVMGLKWSSQYCPGVNYILKADEDTFVNIPMLVDILQLPETPRNSIIGRINPESIVYRVGKWKVDKKVYAKQVYPPYAAGNTYIIPGCLARKLFKASEYHLYIHVEDAFITGLLALSVGATHLDMPGFTYQGDPSPVACDFIMDIKISGTKVNMGLMRHMWSTIKKVRDCEE